MAKKSKTEATPEETAQEHARAEAEILTPEEYQVLRADEIWSWQGGTSDLTTEQNLFVRSYIIDRDPVAALKRLGYSEEPTKLRRRASVYLADVDVVAAIDVLAQQMMQKLEITAEKVNQRIAAVAFFDPREVMHFDHFGVRLLHSKFWTKEQAYALQSVKQSPQGGVELKLHDGLRAAEMLGKQLGTIKDDSASAAAEAAKAGAEVVMDKIMEALDRTRRPALPAPERPPVEEPGDDAPTTH